MANPQLAKNKQRQIDDQRIVGMRELPTPAQVRAAFPSDCADGVDAARTAVADALRKRDDRLVVVVGPCSVHDPAAAIEYAGMLKEQADRLADDLLVVMRVYFEKPRTTVGWKGLINDPNLNRSFDIDSGLRKARGLLLEINRMGLPCATEFLDTLIPQFLIDLVAWGAIGARTTESQVHREMTSGLSCPIGFKNGTDGSVQIAVDAVLSARSQHHFLATSSDGMSMIAETTGNVDTHVILRGGSPGPNYDEPAVANAVQLHSRAGLDASLMIDCSHANSRKDHVRQIQVAQVVARQVAAGNRNIIGAMIESNLVEGSQKLDDPAKLAYGLSITDACIGWEQTVPVLDNLASAARQRRTGVYSC